VLAKADADGTNVETSETNNENRFTVRIGPDLAVSGVGAPATTAPGATIAVTNTVKNQGGGAAGACSAQIFLSTNATLDASDVLLGTRAVPSLVAGATSQATTNVTIPAGTLAGAYYIVVQADPAGAVTETSEANNTGTAQTRVGPDLSIGAASVTPINAAAGGTVSVSDTTKNTGGAGSPATTTSIYFSSDTVLDAGDVLLGSRSVPGLSAGTSHAGNTVVTIPASAAAGTWQLIVVADTGGVASETNEANNTRTAYVRVGPDLKVASGKAPGKVVAGTSFTVTDSTGNVGGAAAAASTTRYYLSTNAAFDSADVLLGARDVAALAAGATSTASVSLTVPAGTSPARYYLLIVADANGTVPEVYENNNTLSLVLTVN